MDIKKLLDNEIKKRDTITELSFDRPDPLLIAKRYNSEYIYLLCALFAYGNAKQIVKFLDSLPFEILDTDETTIKNSIINFKYRFQNNEDIKHIFLAIYRLKQTSSLENIFLEGYLPHGDVLEGIDSLITSLKKYLRGYYSDGIKFLISTNLKRDKQGVIKYIGNSPYKRYNMFLRWMVRKDNIDVGFWTKVDKKDLIMPLDTHTFNVSLRLNLLYRKTYDLKSAILLTSQLKKFDGKDPIKYDFALYRLGQEKLI